MVFFFIRFSFGFVKRSKSTRKIVCLSEHAYTNGSNIVNSRNVGAENTWMNVVILIDICKMFMHISLSLSLAILFCGNPPISSWANNNYYFNAFDVDKRRIEFGIQFVNVGRFWMESMKNYEICAIASQISKNI